MKISGIYMIKSLVHIERYYIGSAVDLNKRWYKHKLELSKNIHKNKILQNHYNKYGENNFKFTIIEQCKENELLNREQYYIDTFNPYFNICKIAYSRLGKKSYPTNIIKIRKKPKWYKRQPCSEETKEKIRLTQLRGKGNNAKKVINNITGEIFNCIKDVINDTNISYKSLCNQLKGYSKNKTNFTYYNE